MFISNLFKTILNQVDDDNLYVISKDINSKFILQASVSILNDLKNKYPSIKHITKYVEESLSEDDGCLSFVAYRLNIDIIVDEWEYVGDVILNGQIDLLDICRQVWGKASNKLVFRINILEINDDDFRY